MKAPSPVKFTRYNTSNNENTGGSDVATANKKVNSPSSPPTPPSLIKSGDASRQPVSPERQEVGHRSTHLLISCGRGEILRSTDTQDGVPGGRTYGYSQHNRSGCGGC